MNGEIGKGRIRDAGRMISQANDAIERARVLTAAAAVLLREEYGMEHLDNARGVDHIMAGKLPLSITRADCLNAVRVLKCTVELEKLAASMPDSAPLVMFGRAAEKGVAA